MKKLMIQTKTTNGLNTLSVDNTNVIEQSKGIVNANESPMHLLAIKSKEELDSMMDFLDDVCEGSILIDGFEEFIIGYDSNSKAVIYDGEAMVLNLAKHYLESDKEIDEEVDPWEEYCEMAQSYMDFNILGGLSLIPNNEEHPKPIILMYL